MSSGRYKDVNSPDFFNCCWLARLPTWAVDFGKAIGSMFDVINVTLGFELAIVIAKLANYNHKEQVLAKMFEVHNLVIIPMVTIVGFYMIFRQRRPCFDSEKGCTVGTFYGMPSGDAMYGTIIGCFVARTNLILGIIIAISVSYSRVSKGYHTVLQTIVGSTIGIIAFIFYNCVSNDYQWINWLLAFVLPLQVFIDPKLKKQIPKNFNNLHAWVFYDISTLTFDVLICAPKKLDLFKEHSPSIPVSIYYFTAFLFTTIGTYIVEEGL